MLCNERTYFYILLCWIGQTKSRVSSLHEALHCEDYMNVLSCNEKVQIWATYFCGDKEPDKANSLRPILIFR